MSEMPHRDDQPDAHRRAGSSFVAQVLSFGATILNRIVLLAILLRVWGPEQLSEWIVAGSVAVLIGLPDAWTQVQFGNLFHSSYAAGRHDQVNRWVGIAIACYGAAYGSLIATAFALLAWTDLASLILVPGRDLQHLTCLLALLIVDRAVVSLRGAIVHLYRAAGDLTRLINSSTLLSLVSTGGVIAAVLSGASDLVAASVLIAIDVGLGLAVLVIDLKRRMPWLRFRLAFPRWAELRQLGRNIVWYAIDHTGLIAVNDLPVIFLAAMNANPAIVVLFTMARTIANFVRQMQMAAANSIAFELVDRALRAGAAIPADILARCAGTLSLVSAILTAAMAAQSGTILTLWTGKGLPVDVVLFLPLYIGVASAAPMVISALMLSYANKPRANAVARLVQFALLGLASFSLVEFGPLAAVTLGIGLSEVVAQAIVLPLLLRGMNVALPPGSYLKIVGRSILAFALMYGLGFLISGIVPQEQWIGMIFGGIVTGAVACAGAFLVTAREDRHQVLEALSGVLGRFVLRRNLG